MIVAHLSDLHLGFEAYDRDDRGRNVREGDVAWAFHRAVQEVIRLKPDLVVIAGDLFDRPDPPPSALVTLARGLELMRGGLPEALVCMVAGARDAGRRPGRAGPLAAFDTFPNVEAAGGGARSVHVGRLGLHVGLLPREALLHRPLAEPRPDPTARWNVLVAYGEVEPEAPPDGGTGEAAVSVAPDDWDYVALGGSHEVRQVAEQAWYSGALERVGPEPWREVEGERGFLTFDLGTGGIEFHRIPGRSVVTLARVRPPRAGPEEIGDRIDEVAAEVPGGISGKVVHLVVRGVDRPTLVRSAAPSLRRLRRRALHLAVSVERDAPSSGSSAGRASSPNGSGARITAHVADRRSVRAQVVGQLLEGGSLEGRLTRTGNAPDLFLGRISLALARLGASPDLLVALDTLSRREGTESIDRGAVERELKEIEGRLSELEGVEERLRSLEGSATGARESLTEAQGELEAASTGWLRERQDAETTLQSYRDRAREVKERIEELEAAGAEAPCPTCGRPLGETHGSVLDELRGEWEALVQDGRWWSRRREQLDAKPERVRELELEVIRLHAELESDAESLERCRADVRELDELRVRREELRGLAGERAETSSAGGEGSPDRAQERVEEIRAELQDGAAGILDRLLQLGPYVILGDDTGSLEVQGPEGSLSLRDERIRVALLLSMTLAAAASAAALGGERPGRFVVAQPLERLSREVRTRALQILREVDWCDEVALVTVGEVVDGTLEHFDRIVEWSPGTDGAGPRSRSLPAGMGRLRVTRVRDRLTSPGASRHPPGPATPVPDPPEPPPPH